MISIINIGVVSQIFCELYSQSTAVWSTYIVKSFMQLLLWLIIFNINLALFVILEFYIVCSEDNPKLCEHDTFLRWDLDFGPVHEQVLMEWSIGHISPRWASTVISWAFSWISVNCLVSLNVLLGQLNNLVIVEYAKHEKWCWFVERLFLQSSTPLHEFTGFVAI